jgi:hypothetical protein
VALEKAFLQHPKPSSEEIANLAEELNLEREVGYSSLTEVISIQLSHSQTNIPLSKT